MARAERYNHRVKVHFQEPGSSTSHQGHTTNISVSGMFISTDHLLQPGRRIRTTLEADGRQSIIEARVARIQEDGDEQGMGIAFLTVKEIVRELLPETLTMAVQDGLDEGIYRLQIPTRRQFREILQHDLMTGGLFVPTPNPPPLNEKITIDLSIGESAAPPVRFGARVVYRIEPSGPDGAIGGNLMAGVGVDLLDPDSTLPSLQKIAGLQVA